MVAAAAAARFLGTHLSTLVWPLAERLEKVDMCYLSLAARALARRAASRRDTHGMGSRPLQVCDDCLLDCGEK